MHPSRKQAEQESLSVGNHGKCSGSHPHRHRPRDPPCAASRRARGRARHRHGEPGELRAAGRFPGLLLPCHQQRPPHRPQGQAQESLSEARRSETLPAPHEELLRAHPEFLDPDSPSLDARLDIVATVVPELAAQASNKAIAEWGRPATDITHLVVTTNSGAHIPGVDFRLIPLLGLRPSVRRTMLYLNGCFPGSAALRLAKDLAENNRGARVLVVCAELSVMLFGGPKEGCFRTLVNQGLFGDGAGAVIVGADPASQVERPLFEMVSAAQTVVPDSDHAITMHLTKGGYRGNISTRKIPVFIGDNIEQCLHDSFGPLGIADKWNDLFWAVHPGSSAILDHIDTVLKLQPQKLAASRHVLSEYGNMFGVTIIFVLDELRRRHKEQHGVGVPDWGVMMTFGPGLTVETIVLHATQQNGHEVLA